MQTTLNTYPKKHIEPKQDLWDTRNNQPATSRRHLKKQALMPHLGLSQQAQLHKRTDISNTWNLPKFHMDPLNSTF